VNSEHSCWFGGLALQFSYDKDDPFWGPKVVEKVAEKILSVLQDPKDAILFP